MLEIAEPLEGVMIHTCNPIEWFPIERLEEPARCVECGAHTILAEGVVNMGHYVHTYQNGIQEERESFIWTCSYTCFLNFEHRKFMAQC